MKARRVAAVALYVLVVGVVVYYAPDILSGSPAGMPALFYLIFPLSVLARRLWKSGEDKDGGR